MSAATTIRIPNTERRVLNRAAKRKGISLARFLIESAMKEANAPGHRAACLDYRDPVEVPEGAERNMRAYVARKIKGRLEGHR